MFRRPWPEGPIVAATLLVPGFVGFAVAKLLQQSLFEWYLIYLLPGLVAGAAVGAVVAGRWLANKSKRDWLEMLPGLVLVLLRGFLSTLSQLVLHPSCGARQRGRLWRYEARSIQTIQSIGSRLRESFLAWTIITTRMPN